MSQTRAEIFYHENDTILEISSLTNGVTGDYVNNATCTATLYNALGVVIEGQVFPLTLSYVSDSNGVYRGTLSKDLSTATLRNGFVEIDIDGGNGLVANFRIPVEFRYRRF